MGEFYLKGDKVKMTDFAKTQLAWEPYGNYGKADTGILVADQRSDGLLKVKRTNRKTACLYHPSFWVLI